MRKQCYKGNEQFTACVETDGIRRLVFEGLCTIVQGLDEFEHCPSLNLISEL